MNMCNDMAALEFRAQEVEKLVLFILFYLLFIYKWHETRVNSYL